MLQIKVSITEEEYALLQTRANKNLNSVSREARLILRHVLYNEMPTPASIDPVTKQREIAGIEFPAFPDYKITSTATSHTHADITPPGVQPAVSQTVPSQPTTTLQITPDPNAGSINIPYVDVASVKDYTQPQTQSEQKPDIPATPNTSTQQNQPQPVRHIKIVGGDEDAPAPTPKFAPKKLKSTLPVSTDLEIEQVDNEWDAECNEYSTEDFLFDLKNLEEKMREDSPFTDPTKDPDYVALKNYFIKHDLRERFRSLLSDPSRFYPKEGVYEQPQIRYAQAAFRKEKIDEEYIIALLSGTGDTYRATHHMKLYVDEM